MTKPGPRKKKTASGPAIPSIHEGKIILSAWFCLALILCLFAAQNLSHPGLNYDEAIFGGMAKDFLTGQVHGPHFPGSESAEILGRRFPLFIQPYLGALKTWLSLPGYRIFGYKVAVLRSTNLICGVLALLFLMLGTWRWLGLRTALIAGALLAFDPAFFFLSVWDWGAASSSFFTRMLAFYLTVIWWRSNRARYAFLAGFFAGLTLFNKVDFAVCLVSISIAGLICFARPIVARLRGSIRGAAVVVVGFLLGASLMLLKLPVLVGGTLSRGNPRAADEFSEKIQTLSALYDGSYFYRLMSVGGMFERMYAEPLHWLPLFGFLVVTAGAVYALKAVYHSSETPTPRIGLCCLLALVLISLGVIALPGATRIYHAVLVYPLPHLVVALGASLALESAGSIKRRRLIQATTWAALFGLLLSHARGIHSTQAVVRDPGVGGRWSEVFDAFCLENRDRTDLTIVSLDWGFNEQLNFLTQGPQLTEPFWSFGETPSPLPANPRYIYLAYPPEYSLFPYATYYLERARTAGPGVEVRPYYDRKNRIAFYAIQFPKR